MTDRPISRHPIRARQHRGGKIGHGGRMGADIAALVVEELVVKGENTALGVDRGANLMALLPRMIGGDQMLAPVLDPLHRAAEPQRGKADQHVLGIKLAANAEAAADMALEQMHAGGIASQHAGDVVAIPVRHLGGAMKLQHVAGGVIARDRATGFERNAGMAPDREIELDHGMRLAKRGADVPVGFFHDRRFGRAAVFEFPGRRGGIEHDRQFVDRDGDEIGCVLRHIGISREHSGDRLADIAHALPGQDGLAIGCQAFDAGQAEIDRRDLRHVGRRPGRDHARQRQRGTRVDRHDPAVRLGRAHHPHMHHAGKGDVGREPAASRHQGPILETGHGSSDEGHVRPVPARTPHAARRGCAVALPETHRSRCQTATGRR